MIVRNNAQKMLNWLAVKGPATVAQIAAAGVLNSREASDAVQYAIRHGSLVPVKRQGAAANERVLYQPTGTQLPVPKEKRPEVSFDGLLGAWGIASKPPRLQVPTSRRMQIGD